MSDIDQRSSNKISLVRIVKVLKDISPSPEKAIS